MPEKVNKTTFAAMIADRLDLTKQQSSKTIEAIFEEIASQLKIGNSITLSGLGTYHIKERAARTGRNPTTGKAIQIPASKVARFKAGKELKELVNAKNKF